METTQEDNNSIYGALLSTSSKLKFPGSLKKQAFFQNLRHQLLEQLKSLESRLDSQLSITNELSDFFVRRSAVELEFSKILDKMYKNIKNNSFRSKRELNSQWTPSMLNTIMLQLINDTRKEAKERFVLSEVCSQIVFRLNTVAEDLQRIFKQCREVCTEGQEELLKVLHELHTATKTYQSLRMEWKQAEGKLKIVEQQKVKLELGLSKEKIEKSKKIKVIEKEIQKRLNKTNDSKFKALKSKNEYILCMDAANAAVQKYFIEDISDLMDCMDLGYYESVCNALKLHVACEEVKKDSLRNNIEILSKFVSSLDSRGDKQKFLEANNSAFVLPKKFKLIEQDYEDHEDEILETEGFMREELEQRGFQLERRLTTLRLESNEQWKTLETAESTLLTLIQNAENSDSVKDWFVGNSNKDINVINPKIRSDRIDTDQFHISKYRDYMLSTNRIARLQAKYDHIRLVLGLSKDSPEEEKKTSPTCSTSSQLLESSSTQMQRRKRIGYNTTAAVRLFGGSIEEYVEAHKIDIPIIIKSCVRVINRFGLQHQGIFRVSGSQVEINNFRDCFERGEDPLALMNDASDINSVASLLKLYLRELREPLFPIVYFDILMELAQISGNEDQFISKMRNLVTKSLPRSVFIVLRYLFHFLNHLSEYSDENMMDPYNIAICFGPSLIPVPEDKDQVQYQNLVNELIKNVIVNAHEIFDSHSGGELYEKYSGNCHSDETPPPADESRSNSDRLSQEEDSVFLDGKQIDIFADKNVEFMEAIAQYEFKARSSRELSFKKGQLIELYSQVSSDWWKGKTQDGKMGLVPDKYILIKIRDEDEEPTDSFKTPDLVMDLPLASEELTPSTSSTSIPPPEEKPPPESELTGAELFGSQNQCTLKKQPVPKVVLQPKDKIAEQDE